MGLCKDQFTARRGERFLWQQRKRDDGFVLRSNFIEEFSFKILRDRHFAGGNLGGRGADEAELAMAQAFDAVLICRANWGSENPASHGPPCVHVAPAGRWVERGTCGFVGEVCEAGMVFRGTSERARFAIAGKIRTMFREPGAGAILDLRRERGICGAQLGHSCAQARRIKRVDGKSSVTALRTAHAAGEERSGAAGCLGKRSIHNLHKLGIALRKLHRGHRFSIAGVTIVCR